MPLTPETLPRHELVGLSARVTAADSADLLGIEGDVVVETTRTLGIERVGRSPSQGSDRVAHVPKSGTTFEFDLPAGASADAADGDGPHAGVVTIEGRRLVARPARRTENTGDTKWR